MKISEICSKANNFLIYPVQVNPKLTLNQKIAELESINLDNKESLTLNFNPSKITQKIKILESKNNISIKKAIDQNTKTLTLSREARIYITLGNRKSTTYISQEQFKESIQNRLIRIYPKEALCITGVMADLEENSPQDILEAIVEAQILVTDNSINCYNQSLECTSNPTQLKLTILNLHQSNTFSISKLHIKNTWNDLLEQLKMNDRRIFAGQYLTIENIPKEPDENGISRVLEKLFGPYGYINIMSALHNKGSIFDVCTMKDTTLQIHFIADVILTKNIRLNYNELLTLISTDSKPLGKRQILTITDMKEGEDIQETTAFLDKNNNPAQCNFFKMENNCQAVQAFEDCIVSAKTIRNPS